MRACMCIVFLLCGHCPSLHAERLMLIIPELFCTVVVYTSQILKGIKCIFVLVNNRQVWLQTEGYIVPSTSLAIKNNKPSPHVTRLGVPKHFCQEILALKYLYAYEFYGNFI
jgi:hypothetical protein